MQTPVVTDVESLGAGRNRLMREGIRVLPGTPAGIGMTFRVLEEPMFEGLFQPMHLLVVLGIALLLFGPKKLPELGKGLGEGIRKFKSSLREDGQDSLLTSEVHPEKGTPGKYLAVRRV